MSRGLILGITLLACVVVGCGKDKSEAKKRDANPNALGIDDLQAPPPLDASPGTRPSEGTGSARENTNFQAGAGAVQNIRKAGQRTATLNDMQQLGLLMTQMELESNRMPQPTDVKNAIRRDAPTLLALIEDGTIILTGTRDRGGLWAYETEADKRGGVGLVAGTPRRMQADEIQQMLKK
ncbi:MAG: hypothetical protein LC104_15565 [Bacteroidales bacterium]|nr:hypothetical protein [Bacteroidales bacterium]